jgi:hypothetical protein
MRGLSSVSAVFLLLALGAGAHAAPPAAKPAAGAPAPSAMPVAPKSAIPDDPAKIAAAREFIQLYHPRMNLASVKKMLDKFIPRAIARKKQDDPKFDGKKYEAEMRARVMKGSAAKLELQAQIVARHFTMPELQALNLFFKAPLGKKLVDETSKIQRDMLMARRQAGLNTPGASLYAQDKDKDGEDEDEDAPKPRAKVQPKKK